LYRKKVRIQVPMGPDKTARNTDGGPPATDGCPTDELVP
jgi:hypothetical protein